MIKLGLGMGAVSLGIVWIAGAVAAQDVKDLNSLKDAGQAVQEKAESLVDCTPERAAQDAALKEKTGYSTGCTPEKAAKNELKKKAKSINPLQ